MHNTEFIKMTIDNHIRFLFLRYCYHLTVNKDVYCSLFPFYRQQTIRTLCGNLV